MTLPRLLSCWRRLLIWACAIALVVVLASHVPRISGNEFSWNGSVPPQTTAKLLSKDFFLLLPRVPTLSVLKITVLLPSIRGDATAPVIFLDGRLHSRPPPEA
jgi:hypothetical protein